MTSTPEDEDSVVVRMIQVVTSAHTTDGVHLNEGSLLKLMDICTCAAAEKHTRVNCVTVSMGDVVFESYPRLGDLVELTARPVLAGNTSLDIRLGVTKSGAGGRNEVVCDSVFTYVTTKGPNGEKRPCPPLPASPDESVEWETKMALHRRNLLKVERLNSQSTTACTLVDVTQTPRFDLVNHEVVLPPHQNHMGHTFGGVVMAWMAQAALAVASRKSRRAVSTLVIRAVLRVDFRTGSQVSDHLVFRTRLNAVFDGGRSAEVEVRVAKRGLATGEQTEMNTGYFYISGSKVGTGTDVPFRSEDSFEDSEEEVVSNHLRRGAVWRRKLLLARRQLLGGVGNPVNWHPALQHEACLLTIQSVLRLASHDEEGTVDWRDIQDVVGSSSMGVQTVEWTQGESWGRKDTFVLRVVGKLPKAASLQKLLDQLRTQRDQWDDQCDSIEILEGEEEEAQQAPNQLHWDVVLHKAITPKAAVQQCPESGTSEEDNLIIPYCLLRTWQLEERTAILASQSVRHGLAGTVIGAVKPSGWFLDKKKEGIVVTYIGEHNLNPLRKVCQGMSDEKIVHIMAGVTLGWYQKILSMEHGATS